MREDLNLLSSLSDVLEHIKEVESDVLSMSKESMLSISKLLEERGVEIDEEFLKALQTQDIISQQLSATVDAIDSIKKSLDIYKRSLQEDTGMVSKHISKLDIKLKKSLDEAKAKKSAFSGNRLNDEEEEIEFF